MTEHQHGILSCEGLTKDFQSGGKPLRVLENITLQVRRGESVSIVGPSGSGKSTLLSLLAGLDRPTEGKVFYGGKRLDDLPEEEISSLWGRKIGFVFQQYYLLGSLTAEENVRAPLELSGNSLAREKSLEWLGKVGLSLRTGHLPSQLSGGEQQRVALARAMAPEPEILFADEPTGNLDSKTGHEMEELLLSLVRQQGVTLVLVTHEKSFAQKTGRVITLDSGRMV